MICVNELQNMKCNKKEILNLLTIILSPFAPYTGEELWSVLGNTGSVCDAQWSKYEEEYLQEDIVTYTVSFNGKTRFTMEFAVDTDAGAIQKAVLKDERSLKWTEGMEPKKVVVVPGKIINIVTH
jgi:leucyl-tRNA synthetase